MTSIYNYFFPPPTDTNGLGSSTSERTAISGSTAETQKKASTSTGKSTSNIVKNVVTPQLTPEVVTYTPKSKSTTFKPFSDTHSSVRCEKYTGCTLFQMIAVTMAIASVIFLTFGLCYASGFFHFEVFLGPIGSTVFPVAGGLFVFFSGLLVFCSCRTNK